MELEDLYSFYPKLIHVFHRDAMFWDNAGYMVAKERTHLHHMSYVIGGEGKLEANGQLFELAPGMTFHFESGTRLKLISSRNHPLCYFSVQYEAALLHSESEESLGKKPIDELPFPIVIYPTEHHPTGEHFANIYTLWISKEPGYEWRCRLLFLRILEELFLRRMSLGEQHPLASVIRAAMADMNLNYRLPISRASLAKQAGMSENHFSVMFKQLTGSTPLQYIVRVRLDHAKQLLRDTGMPIEAVALAVGYQDPFYFSRLFAKETGMSPRAFRKA